MNRRPTTRTLAIAAALAAAALAPAAADAAQPKAGAYAGKTTQPASNPYSGVIRLQVAKHDAGYKLAKVTTRVKLDCQGDPARVKTLRLPIPDGAGKVSAAGRFDYEVTTTPTSGFAVKGRFVSRTKATGSFGYSDAHSGCYAGDVKWTATFN
jgi:opacity protein-like surface antigen